MKGVYKVVWTDHALDELRRTVASLEAKFFEREIQRLADKIESTLSLIATHPSMFSESTNRKGVRRAVILRFNSLYYRV